MKKNAALIAGILFVAGCAHQGGYGRAGTDTGAGSEVATFDTADSTVMGNEVVQRDSRGHMMLHSPTDPTHQYSLEVSGASSANVGELTATRETPMDFSERERQTERGAANVEATLDQDQMIADSSERGGSVEARGGFSGTASASANSQSTGESGNWGDDNFNPSTSFDQDGIEQSSGELSGAANIYSNPGSEAVVEGNLYNEAPEGAQLNSSPALEENIAGEFEVQERLDGQLNQSELNDPNAADRQAGTFSSSTSGEITHSPESTGDKHGEVEASGAAAGSESGSQSSSSAAESPRDNLTSDATGSAAASERGQLESNNLAQKVKSVLVRESTGTHGLMRHDLARNITVESASDGTIVLKGSVPSEQDKEIVEIRAREVKGVNGIRSEIKVDPAQSPAKRDLSSGHDLEESTDQLKD